MARKTEEEVRGARKITILAAQLNVAEFYEKIALVPVLSPVRLEKAIDDYVNERDALSARFKIKGRIQRPKVAGLMAAAILKNKPVDLCDRDHSPAPVPYESTQGNELLAFWHGLAICAEGATQEQVDRLVGNPLFERWRGDLLVLFENHPANPECFALIFETLSMAFFPDNLSIDIE